MVEILNKEDCCGCSACLNICPKHCITLCKDEEGFLYPSIEKEFCTNCRKCEKVCPIINEKEEQIKINKDKPIPLAYATYIKQKDIRQNSTSGGVFTAIAKEIILLNGVVFGVTFNEEHKIIHTFTEKEEGLGQFRGSKYVQSDIGNSYSQVKEFLENDRYVLFTGMPCQIYGLVNFLGKNYEKLILMDIICHGVGSPKFWSKYLKFQQESYKSSINKILFREKTYGFNSSTMAIYFKNGKSSHKGHDDDCYLAAFYKNLCLRPSCHACSFKSHNRRSDFTIGDYWRIDNEDKNLSDNKGCSLLLIHSEKGKKLYECIQGLYSKEVDFNKALIINGGHRESMLIATTPKNDKRDDFFRDIDKYDIKKLRSKYYPWTIKKRLKYITKPIIYKLGMLEKLKKR